MKKYKQCNRCVMDTSASDIKFNEDGICNYCEELIKVFETEQHSVNKMDSLVAQIKKDGQGKEYDCIVGVSGGVDSTYSLYLAKEHGLRVLAVHMDNGWNSELAVNNIKKIIEKLDVDLYTHVIEWEEYKQLMQSFFDADVVDIELLYDNAMLAVNYQLANKYGIKYILSGSNSSTEGMRMPPSWNWRKLDKKNIKNIGRTKDIKLKTFPSIGRLNLIYYRKIKNIQWINFLDYVDYNKQVCIDFLQENFAFKPYPYKHYESVFTRFYQGYILPNKFGIDKRKLHLSTMIVSEQITRDVVLQELENMPYLSQEALDEDIEYFLKKMGWTRKDLDNYLVRKEKSHLDYGSEMPFWDALSRISKKIFNK